MSDARLHLLDKDRRALCGAEMGDPFTVAAFTQTDARLCSDCAAGREDWTIWAHDPTPPPVFIPAMNNTTFTSGNPTVVYSVVTSSGCKRGDTDE